jgi:hypothetical protein
VVILIEVYSVEGRTGTVIPSGIVGASPMVAFHPVHFDVGVHMTLFLVVFRGWREFEESKPVTGQRDTPPGVCYSPAPAPSRVCCWFVFVLI